MSVNRKEKEALQKNWGISKATANDIPDGTYQFEIVECNYVVSQSGRPAFKMKAEIIGGNEDYEGQFVTDNNNLESAENMGWFKKKLTRLNVVVPEDFEEIMDGTLTDELVGKTFEGQVKTKNDFLNVYVNRLLGESEGSTSSKKDDEEEEEEEEEEEKDIDTSEIEEGDVVKWEGKTGEVVEILEDDGLTRVKMENGKIIRVKTSKLKKQKEKEKEEEEEQEEKEKTKETEIPEPKEVEDLNKKQVNEHLTELGFKPKDISNPRGVLRAYCDIAHNQDEAELNASEIKPLCSALDLKIKRDTPVKKAKKLIIAAIQKQLG